jgi:hypothetical protein
MPLSQAHQKRPLPDWKTKVRSFRRRHTSAASHSLIYFSTAFVFNSALVLKEAGKTGAPASWLKA